MVVTPVVDLRPSQRPELCGGNSPSENGGQSRIAVPAHKSLLRIKPDSGSVFPRLRGRLEQLQLADRLYPGCARAQHFNLWRELSVRL